MKNLSRTLSYALRHNPDDIGIKLDKNGWTNVDVMIYQLNKRGYDVNKDDIINVVESNDKQRFSFFDDEKIRIRANQGHSVNVDLQLKNTRPPVKLYHGTSIRFLDSIFKDGLKKSKRHAVHLSEDKETAKQVGARRGKFSVLVIDSGLMHFDGIKFQKSVNGVWLVDSVPPEYINGNGGQFNG